MKIAATSILRRVLARPAKWILRPQTAAAHMERQRAVADALAANNAAFQHECANALHVILGNMALIMSAPDLLPTNGPAVNGGVDKIDALLKRTFKFIRVFDQIGPLDISAAAAAYMIPKGKGIDIAYEIKGQSGKVLADKDGLELVFAELLANSVSASPNGGRINVSFLSPVKTAFGLEGVKYARTVVEDQGNGIPASVLPKLFKPLISDPHEGGNGMRGGFGLCLASCTLAKMGGWIQLVRTAPTGTSFAFYLPSAD